MRIKLAIIILPVVGVVLTANLLMDNRQLSRVQLEKVTTACPGCHGRVPAYDAAIKVHNKHAAFNCSRCHSDNSALKVADNFHASLEWLSIGITLFALICISTILIIDRRGKVN